MSGTRSPIVKEDGSAIAKARVNLLPAQLYRRPGAVGPRPRPHGAVRGHPPAERAYKENPRGARIIQAESGHGTCDEYVQRAWRPAVRFSAPIH